MRIAELVSLTDSLGYDPDPHDVTVSDDIEHRQQFLQELGVGLGHAFAVAGVKPNAANAERDRRRAAYDVSTNGGDGTDPSWYGR